MPTKHLGRFCFGLLDLIDECSAAIHFLSSASFLREISSFISMVELELPISLLVSGTNLEPWYRESFSLDASYSISENVLEQCQVTIRVYIGINFHVNTLIRGSAARG